MGCSRRRRRTELRQHVIPAAAANRIDCPCVRGFLSLKLARRPASLASGSACSGVHASRRYARRLRNSLHTGPSVPDRAVHGKWTRCLPARHQASAARQSAGKHVGRLPQPPSEDKREELPKRGLCLGKFGGKGVRAIWVACGSRHRRGSSRRSPWYCRRCKPRYPRIPRVGRGAAEMAPVYQGTPALPRACRPSLAS